MGKFSHDEYMLKNGQLCDDELKKSHEWLSVAERI